MRLARRHEEQAQRTKGRAASEALIAARDQELGQAAAAAAERRTARRRSREQAEAVAAGRAEKRGRDAVAAADAADQAARRCAAREQEQARRAKGRAASEAQIAAREQELGQAAAAAAGRRTVRRRRREQADAAAAGRAEKRGRDAVAAGVAADRVARRRAARRQGQARRAEGRAKLEAAATARALARAGRAAELEAAATARARVKEGRRRVRWLHAHLLAESRTCSYSRVAKAPSVGSPIAGGELYRCSSCATVLFGAETSALCCKSGRVVLAQTVKVRQPDGSERLLRSREDAAENPPALESLLRHPKIGEYARGINNLFALTSIGCRRKDNPGAGFVTTERPGCLRLHGQAYHRVLPADRDVGEECGLSYYLYHKKYERARSELAAALSSRRGRDDLRARVDDFRAYLLRHNRHVREIRSLNDSVDGTPLGAVEQFHVVLRHDVRTDELAYFHVHDVAGGVDAAQIVFCRQRDGEPEFVSVDSPFYDQLQFLLLHPTGGRGWYPLMRMRGRPVTLASYTRAVHVQDVGARLARLGALRDQVLLDNHSRIRCHRAAYWRSHQMQKMCASVRRIRSPGSDQRRVGRVFLPSVVGSAVYQSELVKDAMAVVVRLGPPTYFITMTANPYWPEVEALTTPQCTPCQTALSGANAERCDAVVAAREDAAARSEAAAAAADEAVDSASASARTAAVARAAAARAAATLARRFADDARASFRARAVGLRPGCRACVKCPLVVARVFKQKMERMMGVVKRWDGGVEYYFLVVEFQHRGLPHCHLALRCKDPLTLVQSNRSHAESDPARRGVGDFASAAAVGQRAREACWRPHVDTEMPRDVFERTAGPDGALVTTPDALMDPAIPGKRVNQRYRELVCEHMLHHCQRLYGPDSKRFNPCRYITLGGVTRQCAYCTKAFPKPYIEHAQVTDTGYPVYCRTPLDPQADRAVVRDLEDLIETKLKRGYTVDDVLRRVVPHNRQLLEMFECHINVEYAGSVHLIRCAPGRGVVSPASAMSAVASF